MRVISGIRKGHKLKAPKGENTRPTEDSIKESLFNILGSLPLNARVLDLFAGTGAIGIEFLSRGAEETLFVDSSNESIKTIKENLEHTKFLDKSKVYKKGSLNAINVFDNENLKFDYIYIDPPFKEHSLLFDTLEVLREKNILKDNGMIIIEHEEKLNLQKLIKGFEIIDFRNYGNKAIIFLKKPKEEVDESNISR